MKRLFSAIADKYDRMNHIMSLGLDRCWRRIALQGIVLPPDSSILDLACGTGDFTLELLKRYPSANITGVDITPEMMSIAKKKLPARNTVNFSVGDAQNLSFLKNSSFSLVVCAFGFRNFPDKAKALSECHRILKPDGRLIVLELFRPERKLTGILVDTWLAIISGIFARDSKIEYLYLRKSVANTVSANEFSKMAINAGFSLRNMKFLPPAANCAVLQKARPVPSPADLG
jgi:demethylmenaquinone methyltransferase/2-methoxy-6-polyprenyl-1,4-benzoquinol methylase